jgi:hypothetical protein
MALTDNLLGYWKLNESSGTPAEDSWSTNDGTNTDITYTASGKIGRCYDFDQVTSKVSVGDVSSFDFGTTTDFSVSVWFKTVTTNTCYLICKYNGGGSLGWGIEVVTGTNLYAFATDGTNTIFHYCGTGVNDGNWHHLAVSFDRNGNCVSYLDGGAGSSESMSTVGDISNNYNLLFGIRNDGNNNYTGALDEIAIWNRVITSDEASTLYGSGSGYEIPLYTYNGVLYVWSGSAWVPRILNEYEGSFSARPVRYWSGSSWELVQSF